MNMYIINQSIYIYIYICSFDKINQNHVHFSMIMRLYPASHCFSPFIVLDEKTNSWSAPKPRNKKLTCNVPSAVLSQKWTTAVSFNAEGWCFCKCGITRTWVASLQTHISWGGLGDVPPSGGKPWCGSNWIITHLYGCWSQFCTPVLDGCL